MLETCCVCSAKSVLWLHKHRWILCMGHEKQRALRLQRFTVSVKWVWVSFALYSVCLTSNKVLTVSVEWVWIKVKFFMQASIGRQVACEVVKSYPAVHTFINTRNDPRPWCFKSAADAQMLLNTSRSQCCYRFCCCCYQRCYQCFAVTSAVTSAVMGAGMGAVAVGPYAGHVAVGNK